MARIVNPCECRVPQEIKSGNSFFFFFQRAWQSQGNIGDFHRVASSEGKWRPHIPVVLHLQSYVLGIGRLLLLAVTSSFAFIRNWPFPNTLSIILVTCLTSSMLDLTTKRSWWTNLEAKNTFLIHSVRASNTLRVKNHTQLNKFLTRVQDQILFWRTFCPE